MTITELLERLQAECFNPTEYGIGDDCRRNSNIHCLEAEDEGFVIYYTERGVMGEVYGRYPTEEEACEAYYGCLCRSISTHADLVGQYSEGALVEKTAVLDAHSIRYYTFRNTVFGSEDPSFRLYVYRADLPRARPVLGIET